MGWRTLPEMPTARYTCTAATNSGRLFVIGGQDGMDVLTTVECYDPKLRIWSSFASLPFPCYGCAAASAGGTLYVMGGHNGLQALATVLQLQEHKCCNWILLPPLPKAVSLCAAVAS